MKENDILNKIKNTRLLAAIGLVAMLIGTFLPYLQTTLLWSSISLPLWGYWQGKVTVLLIIANAIFIFKDYIEKYIPSLLNVEIWKKISEVKNPKMSLIPTGILLVLLLWLTIDLGFDFRMYGIGFYILWIGVICLVAYAVINKGNINIATSENNAVNMNVNNMNQNMNNNFNNGMNTNVNPNYNNGVNTNVNQNYNNGMNGNVNQNYNNGMNANVNQNYNNGNMNQGYNNMNNNTQGMQNYNNGMNNQGYNNVNNNTTQGMQNYNNGTNTNDSQNNI